MSAGNINNLYFSWNVFDGVKSAKAIAHLEFQGVSHGLSFVLLTLSPIF